MDNIDSYKIGPRREYLLLAVPLLITALLFIFHVFKITVPQAKGSLIIVSGAAILFFWRGGYYLIVDNRGIRENIYGLCFRTIPWDQVSAAVCYPTFDGKTIGQTIKILILLKGRRQNGVPTIDPEYYHFKHPLKSLYIDHGNFSAIFAKYTVLTTSDAWGQW